MACVYYHVCIHSAHTATFVSVESSLMNFAFYKAIIF